MAVYCTTCNKRLLMHEILLCTHVPCHNKVQSTGSNINNGGVDRWNSPLDSVVSTPINFNYHFISGTNSCASNDSNSDSNSFSGGGGDTGGGGSNGDW